MGYLTSECLSVQIFPETSWALESHTYKGVGNYKYRTVINRVDIPCAGWITEDSSVCVCLCLCVPWALVSVPTTCPPSVLPFLNPSFRLSRTSVIKHRLICSLLDFCFPFATLYLYSTTSQREIFYFLLCISPIAASYFRNALLKMNQWLHSGLWPLTKETFPL